MANLNHNNIAIRALTLLEIVDAINQFIKSQRTIAKACLVCKAWQEAWTPLLWKLMEFDRKDDEIPDSIMKYGHYIRDLEYENPKDEHLSFVLPYCRNLNGLTLTNTRITMESLAPYLRDDHFGRTLRRIELDVHGVRAEDLFPVLTKHCRRLERIDLAFPYFIIKPELRHSVFMRLLTACRHLVELKIWNTSIVDELEEDMERKGGMEETEGESRGDDVVGLQNSSKPCQLEVLDFFHIAQTDICFSKLLRKCPNLKRINIGPSSTLTEKSFLQILELCPNVDSLSITECTSMSSSGVSQLIQGTRHHSLQLQNIRMRGHPADNQVARQIAYNQSQSLVSLDLKGATEVTDDGVDVILRHCCRLESLFLSGQVITSYIMDGPQDRWGCYTTLKELDIRRVGIHELPHGYDEDDWRVGVNRESFKLIKRRIEMLPNLKKLAMSFFGLQSEFIQGFGCGNDDKDRDEIQESGTDYDETKNLEAEECVRNGGRSLKAHKGPSIQVLGVRGLDSNLSREDFATFLKNYPNLRSFIATKCYLEVELVNMLYAAGKKYQDSSETLYRE
ncbi:hypothetical protein BGX27_001556 [Mortierella sp. AM989]|nr:hypothetical protein BGX27_001556 [Mortierella sp. AM989]